MNDSQWSVINSRYFFYAEQAYHQALLIHSEGKPSTNRTSSSDAAKAYAERMSLTGVAPEIFLQDTFDNVQTTNNAQDGITILNYDETKGLNFSPTDELIMDKVTFFEDNRVGAVFARNGITGEMIPFDEYEGMQGLPTQHTKVEEIDRIDFVPLEDDVPFVPREAVPFVPRETDTFVPREAEPGYYSSNSFDNFFKRVNSDKIVNSDKRVGKATSSPSANLSAFNIAIEQGDLERMQEIVANDPGVINRKTSVSKSFPLLMAIQNDNAEAVAFIMSKHPNLLLTTEDGESVLSELPKLSDEKLRKKVESAYVAQKMAFENNLTR